jgi:3-phosphoshikimate 1-carboxyvinyltransferase
MMDSFGSDSRHVRGGVPLCGILQVPGDKSISHRGLLIGALTPGESILTGLSTGADVASTRRALEAMGAQVEISPDATVCISGGEGRLREPHRPIDCGNSGTTMRLLAGMVAGWPWTVQLVGDESLSKRPMDRVAVPLRLMGAVASGVGERCHPPLTVSGGALQGITYLLPVPSAQVKSAVLLAGLRATGQTVVSETHPTRAHTEDLLLLAGADIDVTPASASEPYRVRVRPGPLSPFRLDVPGDPSQAAFWIVASCLVPGSTVRIQQVYTGPGRRGFLDVLHRMGAEIVEQPVPGAGPTADILATAGRLVATEVLAEEIPGLIDEVPILALAASLAEGVTVFHGLGELRVKESDRLSGIVSLLTSFGARAEIDGEDLRIDGVSHLTSPTRPVFSKGDHRMAMTAAVAAMTLPPTEHHDVIVHGWSAVNTSYPDFLSTHRALTHGTARSREPGGSR